MEEDNRFFSRFIITARANNALPGDAVADSIVDESDGGGAESMRFLFVNALAWPLGSRDRGFARGERPRLFLSCEPAALCCLPAITRQTAH